MPKQGPNNNTSNTEQSTSHGRGHWFKSSTAHHFNPDSEIASSSSELIEFENESQPSNPNSARSRAKVRQSYTNLLTTQQVAEKLGVNESTIRRWCQSGRLPALTRPFGKKVTYLVNPQALEIMVAQQSKDQTQHNKRGKQPQSHSDFIPNWVRAMEKV